MADKAQEGHVQLKNLITLHFQTHCSLCSAHIIHSNTGVGTVIITAHIHNPEAPIPQQSVIPRASEDNSLSRETPREQDGRIREHFARKYSRRWGNHGNTYQ